MTKVNQKTPQIWATHLLLFQAPGSLFQSKQRNSGLVKNAEANISIATPSELYFMRYLLRHPLKSC